MYLGNIGVSINLVFFWVVVSLFVCFVRKDDVI